MRRVPIPESGSRKVEPSQTRRRKDTPSDRARKARRLTERIEASTQERHEAWTEGDHPNVTAALTSDLESLHGDKREMRRDIYRHAPELEGRPLYRGRPGGSA